MLIIYSRGIVKKTPSGGIQNQLRHLQRAELGVLIVGMACEHQYCSSTYMHGHKKQKHYSEFCYSIIIVTPLFVGNLKRNRNGRKIASRIPRITTISMKQMTLNDIELVVSELLMSRGIWHNKTKYLSISWETCTCQPDMPHPC